MAGSKKTDRDNKVSDEVAEVSFRKEDIFDTITGMLADLLEIKKEDLRSDTMIFEELPLDSLQLYEMVVDLEAKFKIRIPDEAIEKITTIGDVVDMIHEAGK